MQRNKEWLLLFLAMCGTRGVGQGDPDLCAAESLKASTGQPLLPSLAFSAPSQVVRQTKPCPHRSARGKKRRELSHLSLGSGNFPFSVK